MGTFSIGYSKEEIENAYKKLDKFAEALTNSGENWGVVSNNYKDEIWERKSFKRSYLTDVEILNCTFTSCALVGSIFQKVNFADTAFLGSNLTFCAFHYCKFNFTEKITAYEGCNFGSSEFVNCQFRNIAFKASTLSQSRFINCTFEKCEFSSDTLENTVFDGCVFNRVNMRSLNIEFSTFKNCKLTYVSFPFLQFPYIIGAKEILSDSKNSDGELVFCIRGQEVKQAEYEDLLPSLAIYYEEKNNLFPYANLMIILDRSEQIANIIAEGLKGSLRDKNFRIAEHFCRLGKHYSVINSHLAQNIIHSIDDTIITLNNETPTLQESGIVSSAALSASNIRNILLYDKSNKQELQFEIETKIPIEDTKRINALQNSVQEVIDRYSTDKSQQFIEIRHGSPASFLVQFVVDNPAIVAQVALALTRVVVFFGRWGWRRHKLKKESNFIPKEILSRYGDKVEIHGSDLTDALKAEIKNIMLETRDQLVSKKRSTINKYVNSITQRIFETIDNRLQTDKSCMILTTRRADSLTSN